MKKSLLILYCGGALTGGWFAGKPGRPVAAGARVLQTADQHKTTEASPADFSALLADPSPDAVILLAARVSGLGFDEILERLRGLDRYAAGTHHLFAAAMIERLVSLDPERALDAVPAFMALGELFAEALGRAAAGRDAQTAQNWMARIPDVDTFLAQHFWQAFGAGASPALYEALPAGSFGPVKAQEAFIRQWAAIDPAACAAWAAARPKTWGAAAAAMAQKDPKAALAWIESLPAKGGRAAARGRVYEEWAARDPLAAFAASQEDGSPLTRQNPQILGNHLANLPLEEVLPIAVSAPAASAIRNWLWQWTDRDPVAVAGALVQLPESAGRQTLIFAAAERWRISGSDETRSAMRHVLEEVPPGDIRAAVSKAWIESSARAGDVSGAFAMLEKEIPAAAREETTKRLASALLSRDPAAYAENLDRIPPPCRSPRQNLLQLWNQHDPAAAKAWEAAHPE